MRKLEENVFQHDVYRTFDEYLGFFIKLLYEITLYELPYECRRLSHFIAREYRLSLVRFGAMFKL